MARFNAEQVDNYGGQGQGGFFSLKNDKDLATVRFMYNSMDDIEGFAVHEIEVDGKKRYVNCLRDYNQPVDDCPLCAAKYKVVAKLFIPLYDEESGELKIWDRGKNFFSKISSLATRYNPMVATPFEIERNGKAGDTKTTYEIYALDTDETALEDLPEVPEILGGLVLDKTYEELEEFLEIGYFPDDEEEEAPPVRRGAASKPTGRQPASRQAAKPTRGAATTRREAPAKRGAAKAKEVEEEIPFEAEEKPAKPVRRGAATPNRPTNKDKF